MWHDYEIESETKSPYEQLKEEVKRLKRALFYTILAVTIAAIGFLVFIFKSVPFL